MKIETKVKISFLTEQVYDDMYFKAFDELLLPLTDAKELVNDGVAVITYISD